MLIAYARVSTSDQNSDLQIDELKAAGCEKVFSESASGTQTNRPELMAALEFAREGDVLCVWRLDRLARSMKQLINTVDELDKRKIGFRSLRESIDTTTPGGRLVFHIFGSLAQFERELIVERTKAGLEAARKRGRIGGRPRALSSGDMKAAKAMLQDPDITIQEIANHLGVGPSTIYRAFPGGRSGAMAEAGGT